MEKVKILSIVNDTHDVVHLKTERPKSIDFKPGQAVDVALDDPKWKEELRPFTFTSIPTEDHLEFYIKTYPERKGVTAQIGKLKKGDNILLGEVFGAIQYKGEGIFIAGGAGITPFISIIRELEYQNKVGNNKLIFANKKEEDIIAKLLFENAFGKSFVNVLSEEDKKAYEHGFINKTLIKKEMEGKEKYIYLCGPPPMMDAVLKELDEMGIEKSKIVKEDF